MKRLIPFIAAIFLLNGCFAEEEKSALDAVRSESNQSTHFRPVHRLHDDWTMRKLGHTVTLLTGDRHIKVSTRRETKTVIIRENGSIIGSIGLTSEGAHFISSGKVAEPLNYECRINRTPVITLPGHKLQVIPTQNGLAAGNLEVRKLKPRKRYSIVDNRLSGTCDGSELEMPFSTLGVLIFHLDDIPLAQRMGLAWFVTEFQADCDQ